MYVTDAAKRAVVVKDDDLMTRKEILENQAGVAEATLAELKTWISNTCFKMCLIKDAENIMTSRYVAKWKWIRLPDDKHADNATVQSEGLTLAERQQRWLKIIRMRLVLRGFMDIEAFSLDTFSGTAKRSSQRMLASEAACHEDFIIASLDIDQAFWKGFTHAELAAATGEK